MSKEKLIKLTLINQEPLKFPKVCKKFIDGLRKLESKQR